MIAYLFAFVTRWWRRRGHPNALGRSDLQTLAALSRQALPRFVQESPAAQSYLALFGPLAWSQFPERPSVRLWPGRPPIPRAAFVAAYLLKLDKGLKSVKKLRDELVQQPALVWLFGFPLVPSSAYRWGFDVERSLPTPRHFSRVLRTLDHAQATFLFQATVRLLDAELADEVLFGNEISLDTKHILAWVRENNPKAKVPHRYDKSHQPKGDPDCKLGCKKRHNVPTHDGSDTTPTQEGMPARQATVGEFYWGYASGIVATKVEEIGEFVLAELTQTFNQSDQSYFYPLMAQVEENLGRKPQFGALDKAYDNFYVHEYFHAAGGFAAVPWSDRGPKKQFSPEGLPLCAAGLAMPLKSKFMERSNCLVEHQCARYACPLLFPAPTGEVCPIDHANWPKGCITTLPTSPGNRIRHELDRNSAEYKRIYKQRTATERINSQALDLGIERPKLRNRRSIANQDTLIYVLINLRALQRVRQAKAEKTKIQASGA
jgi:Transposase DDE domain